MREWRQRTWAALLGMSLVGGAAVATQAIGHSGNLQPLTVGWEQYFDIRWGVARQDRGALVEGFITNTWGMPARDVRVLVNTYDASGARTSQVIAWGPKEIQPGGRAYFDVTVPDRAATYDVSILSWEWFWSSSGGGM
jgi:hypothetical protein